MRPLVVAGLIGFSALIIWLNVYAEKAERQRIAASTFAATVQSHSPDSLIRIKVKSPAGVVLPAELEPKDFVSLPDGSKVECRFVNTKHVVCKPLTNERRGAS